MSSIRSNMQRWCFLLLPYAVNCYTERYHVKPVSWCSKQTSNNNNTLVLYKINTRYQMRFSAYLYRFYIPHLKYKFKQWVCPCNCPCKFIKQCKFETFNNENASKWISLLAAEEAFFMQVHRGMQIIAEKFEIVIVNRKFNR